MPDELRGGSGGGGGDDAARDKRSRPEQWRSDVGFLSADAEIYTAGRLIYNANTTGFFLDFIKYTIHKN